MIKNKKIKKDISCQNALLFMGVLVLIKLALVSFQCVYILPKSAPIDDDLYFNWAVSIADGNWLGEYGYLTLSKYPFFAIWLAGLSKLNIPYLIGGQLIWVVVSAITVLAFMPVLKSNKAKVLVFAALLYNPATVASFTLRVYRDSIFPALCTLFFVGMAGFALRYDKPLKNFIGFLIAAGMGLGFAWVTREDGIWMLPFALVAVLIVAIYIYQKFILNQKKLRVLAMLIPFGITAGIYLCICSVNYYHYGRFILSDFTSDEFTQAYGNMTRLSHEDWNPLVSVPEDVREKLYAGSPSFKKLQPYLESDKYALAYKNPKVGDYQSGSFYWALRHAASQAGMYQTANTAKAYFQQLNTEIEQLCSQDPGALKKRKGTTPPIKLEYVPMVLKEGFETLAFAVTFQDMNCYMATGLSDITTGQIPKWENFLKEKSNYAAVEYTDTPYYTPTQHLVYKFMNSWVWVYRLIVPIGMVLFAVCFVIFAFQFKNAQDKTQLICWIGLGFLGMAIFRVFMIAFMEVAAFNIGKSAMYLGAVYPLMILTAVCGFILAYKLKNRYE